MKDITETYKRFCAAEGSQHIASEFAIQRLLGIMERFRINQILEVGLGIGSIAGIVLGYSKRGLLYTGTENNDFCLSSLPLNLAADFSRLNIYADLSSIPLTTKFDLIIVDGQDPQLVLIEELISEHGIIAIEGDRMDQQVQLGLYFPQHKFVHLISSRKNKSYSPFPSTHWQGGLKVIFVNPTSKQKIWLLKEKVKTKLTYWLRG